MNLGHFTLSFLAVLLPIALIELPRAGQLASRAMPPISGTYDVLLLAAALPKDQVRALLPPSVSQGAGSKQDYDALLSVPDAYWRTMVGVKGNNVEDQQQQHADEHLILLQMGYQSQTGPGPSWMPKMSFGECKLEIPFVRHPDGNPGVDVPFVYKQHILSDNPIIKMSSSVLGLTSASARFVPDKAPTVFDADAAELSYRAEDYLEARASKPAVPLADDVRESSWHFYNELLNAWWFGERTGQSAQKFDFDISSAKVQPALYEVTVTINLQAFASSHGGQSASTLPKEPIAVHGLGWRVSAPFISKSQKANSILPA